MALDPVKNFAKVEVSTGYDAAATSITLVSGQGAKLPAASFNLVWWNYTDYPDPADDSNVEIVRCTVISTDVLTVTRSQEGTSATVKNIAGKTYKMAVSLTKKMKDDIADHPLTTKGDMSVYDTAKNRLAVGINNEVLTAASGESSGVKWAAALAAGGTIGGDTFISNGFGMVIGHDSQVTVSNTPEFQVLGTGGADAAMLLARFKNNTSGPTIRFLKSRNDVIGSLAIVQDDDSIGAFKYYADDGVDFATEAAQFGVEVDDASPAAGDIGTAFVWQQMAGGAAALAETMRLSAAGLLTVASITTTGLITGVGLDAGDGNITNVGDIALDSLSSDAGAGITITPTTDTFFSNGTGVVIGHTAQVTVSNTPEFQVLGTGGADSSMLIARWKTDEKGPNLNFLKSKNATIGSHTIVADNDLVGTIKWFPDDGVDFATEAASFRAEVDDASPAAGDIGVAYVWSQMAGGGAALAETMRLSAAGLLTVATITTTGLISAGTVTTTGLITGVGLDASDGNITNVQDIALDSITADGTEITLLSNTFIANSSGMVIGHESQIVTDNTAEFQVVGTGGADSTALLARFKSNNKGPSMRFLKSRNNAIGSHTIVQDGDTVGRFKWYADDGVDFTTEMASLDVVVDDASPAAGDIGAAFVFFQMQGGGAAQAETMRLDAKGNLTLSIGSSIFLTEKADADADVAGKGQIWVDTATPNVLYFTDDAGTDFNLSGGGTSAPVMIMATIFETSSRFGGTVVNSGQNGYHLGNGLMQETGSTQASSAEARWVVMNNTRIEDGSPTISTHIYLAAMGTDFNACFGMGNLVVSGTAITYTGKHIGFAVKRVSSGDINLTATQADGTTETASATLTTLSAGQDVDLIVVATSSSSVDYYYRVNNAALSSATNLTANFPDFMSYMAWATSNMDVASNTAFTVPSASYQR